MLLMLEYIIPFKQGCPGVKEGGNILDSDSTLPGIEVFKLSMTSKQFFFLLHTVFSPMKFKNYRKNHELKKF